MSVPGFLEWSYNSACPGCGLAGWQHEQGCEYDAPAQDAEPIRYHCCYCGGTFNATEADIAAAQASAAEEGARGMALPDAEAFRDYGRDVCDAHLAAWQAADALHRQERVA